MTQDRKGLKKIGVPVDNWKTTAFTKEFEKLGFTDIEAKPLMKGVTLIAMYVKPEEFETKKEIVRRACVKLQMTLKRMN